MKKAHVVAGAILVAGLVAWFVLAKLPALKVPPSEVIDTATTTASTTPLSATSSDVTASTTVKEEDIAEPALLALDVKPWEWVSATYADGRTLAPTTKGDFVMTFGAGGGVSFETDCNSMSSSYEAYTGGLTFAPIASTKMYCEGSKETEFAKLIAETKTYRFTQKGELLLETGAGDVVTFK
jgi:heat shock protein HslJ